MVGRFLVPAAMRTGYKAERASFSQMGEQVKKDRDNLKGWVKDNYDPRQPLFKKDTEEGRTINNLYTGYKLGGKGNLLVTGSLLGGGTIYVANPNNVNRTVLNGQNAKFQSEEQDIESMQSTRADGQGYKAAIGAAALENLSASGDLVFAMHKTRHSGQF